LRSALELGNLHDAPLEELAAHWRAVVLPLFSTVCRDAFDDATAPAELPLTNWYEVVAKRADQVAVY
jgi:hypothetical protein